MEAIEVLWRSGVSVVTSLLSDIPYPYFLKWVGEFGRVQSPISNGLI